MNFTLQMAQLSRLKFWVGAEGTWSKVRTLVSEKKPEYAGMSYVDVSSYDVDERHTAEAEAVGAGAMYALVPGKGFPCSPRSEQHHPHLCRAVPPS